MKTKNEFKLKKIIHAVRLNNSTFNPLCLDVER